MKMNLRKLLLVGDMALFCVLYWLICLSAQMYETQWVFVEGFPRLLIDENGFYPNGTKAFLCDVWLHHWLDTKLLWALFYAYCLVTIVGSFIEIIHAIAKELIALVNQLLRLLVRSALITLKRRSGGRRMLRVLATSRVPRWFIQVPLKQSGQHTHTALR